MKLRPKLNPVIEEMLAITIDSVNITVRQSLHHSVRRGVQSGQQLFASCSPPNAQPGVSSALTPPVRHSPPRH